MAKGLYNLKFTSNFRFSKLRAKLDDIIGNQSEVITDSIAKNTKKNILTAGTRKLSPNTLEIRRRGLSTFAGHNPSPTTEARPLLYSKRLFDSIKGTKKGLEMMDYGLIHQEGFKTKEGFDVPPREFIASMDDDKDALKEVQNDLVKKMNRAMRK